ncbi:MAG: Hsp20/alpha crystallin family protein [Thermodesulfovibrionales bacterium]
MQDSIRELRFLFAGHATAEPLVDMYETDAELVCEIDLPGVSPDDVHIQVYDNLLIIEGSRSEAGGELKGFRFLCMERSMERFRRIIKIPVAVEPSKGVATYRQGVVRVLLPKAKETVVHIRIERQEGE